MLTRRAMRFGITGGINTSLHIAVASSWIHFVHPDPSFANGVAFLVATMFSYATNTLWSFSGQFDRATFVKFWLVALLGLPLTAGIAGVANWMGLHYAYGIAAVVCVMPPINFMMHNFWTYRIPATPKYQPGEPR
jgi:putative flippase GtrA